MASAARHGWRGLLRRWLTLVSILDRHAEGFANRIYQVWLDWLFCIDSLDGTDGIRRIDRLWNLMHLLAGI
jgi:hypothetical protein